MQVLTKGVYIQTKAELKKQQKDWTEEDPCKHLNFDEYAYWVTTDDGQTPQGFKYLYQAKNYVLNNI